MNAIDTFPAVDMPLRARLPNLSEGTRDALIRWGEAQPGSLPWLLVRAAGYWEVKPTPPPGQSVDEYFMTLDATAALDLLRHRIQSTTDREAVEHLNMGNGE